MCHHLFGPEILAQDLGAWNDPGLVYGTHVACLSSKISLLTSEVLVGLGGHARTVPKFRPRNRQNYMAAALDKLRCFDRIHPAKRLERKGHQPQHHQKKGGEYEEYIRILISLEVS